jgi:ParB family transcriptional regulator, chromosome partitioning protein
VSEKRRGLGRGLGSLIPTAPEGSTRTAERPVDVFFGDRDESGSPAAVDDGGLLPVPGAYFAEIPLDRITPNPKQPRQVFDEDEMAELVHSIKEIGVLQPVVVRPVPGGSATGPEARYELIMGERRWRASEQAGLTSVPAIVRETAEDDLLRDALLENLHRSQLNPLEEAAAYQQLLDDFGCTHEELAARIGRSRPQISNTLRLLRLPPLVQRRVAAGVLSAGHARALLGLDDAAAMERLAQRIVAEGLSVRSVEEIVAVGEDKPVTPRAPRAGTRMAMLDDLAARLSDRLDTRVKIALGRRKGRLTVEFATVEDLQRIVHQIAPGEDAPFSG